MDPLGRRGGAAGPTETVIADRFEIHGLAGRGATAAVYRARDRATEEMVALKVLVFDLEVSRRRFLHEASILATVTHPGVVRYVAHGVSDSTVYLALEWIEGETLARRLSRGPLSIDDVLAVGSRMADALREAHTRGIVHRDLKPSNAMLPFGSVRDLKILDFGLARIPDAAVTLSGTTVGTPGYMAPEQARGERVDARADVFALGCILYQCIAGRAPFVADDAVAVLLKIVLEEPPPLSRYRPDLPPAVEDLVVRMLSKDPARRPADASAVAAEIAACVDATAAPPSVRARAITGSERQSLSLVLARGGVVSARSPEDQDHRAGASAPRLAWVRAVRAAVARCDAECDFLPDGTTLVAVTGRAVATDRAAQAARSALAIREAWPDASIAVVSGRSEPVADGPLARVIEQAVALLQLADASAILIDETSFGLLDARFDVRTDGASLVLLGERGGGDAVRTLLGRPTPFVGRDRELASLSSAFEECVAEPRSLALLVTGPAGIGKSRLRYELLRRISEADSVAIWTGGADPLLAGAPLALASLVLRHALDLRDGEPLAARQRKLAARTRRHLADADAARVADFLGEIVGTPAAAPGVQLAAARRDPSTMWDQVRRAVVDLLRAETEAAPVVLVLEDLHWGDAQTIELFDFVLQQLPDSPLLLLALARPEVTDVFPDLWAHRNVDVIRLGELGRRGAERLVRSVLGQDIGDASMRLLVDRAAGNVFYLEELIRAFAEDEGERLPDTVLAMTEARLSRLDAEARRVLRAASVFGASFSAPGVAALLGEDGKPELLAPQLAKLVAQEAIGVTGATPSGMPEYVFRHALVREAAYATLTEADRKLAHRLAASWLETSGDADPIVLAEHCHRGGAVDRAATWFERAAHHALARNDMDAATTRAGRAIECGAQGEALARLRLVQAEAARARGHESVALVRAEEAVRLLPEGTGAWHEAAVEAAFASNALGHVDRLEQIAAILVRVVPAPDVTWQRAFALVHVALMMDMRTLTEGLRAVTARLDEEIRAAPPDPMTEAALWVLRSRDAQAAHDFGTYCMALQRSAACYERAGAARQACRHRSSTGFALLCLGGYEAAETCLRECIDIAERMNLSSHAAEARHNLGLVLGHLGRLDEGAAVETEAMETFARIGNQRMVVLCSLYLAVVQLAAGRVAEAADRAEEALCTLDDLPPVRMMAHCVLSDAQLSSGEGGAALEQARAALALGESCGAAAFDMERYSLRVHAQALHAVGDVAEAHAAIRHARNLVLQQAAKIQDPTWRGWFLTKEVDNTKILALASAWLGEPAPTGT